MVVRRLGDDPGSPIRISVRSKQDNDELLRAMSRIPDGIIFDIDGVLIDVSRSYRAAIKGTVESISGRQISDAQIERIKGIPGWNNDWDVSFALINRIDDPSDIDRGSDGYLAVKSRFQELYEGCFEKQERRIVEREVLEKLRSSGLELGIVSGRPRDEAFRSLADLIPLFFSPQSIVTPQDCPDEKPSAAPLLLAKSRMRVSRPIYVGDSINDALAAEAARMPFVLVRPDPGFGRTICGVNNILEVLA
jgi:HAD superfamily hydrolase (TIGR01548 family)